eukprot:UN08396
MELRSSSKVRLEYSKDDKSYTKLENGKYFSGIKKLSLGLLKHVILELFGSPLLIIRELNCNLREMIKYVLNVNTELNLTGTIVRKCAVPCREYR